METKKAWCVKIRIVDECVVITDDVRLFKYLEDAEKVFNKVVEVERKIANDKNFVIEYDDNRNFRAYEDGRFPYNQICIDLFQKEIE